MNPLVRKYKSDFALRYVAEGEAKGRLKGKAEGIAEGKAEGKAEGCANVLLRLLTLRFGPLTKAVQTLVRNACRQRLGEIPDDLLTAKTLKDALSCLQRR